MNLAKGRGKFGERAAMGGKFGEKGQGSVPAAIAAGVAPPGWELDEQGRLKRVKKPRMNRRLPGFDYSQRMIYEITIVLEERRPFLGRLVKKGEGEWSVEQSLFGGAVLECWCRICEFWPQVSLIASQLMPDHFHGVLFVRERLPAGKTLGDIVRGFKAGCTMAWRELAAQSRGECAAPRWADGFVDTILLHKGQLEKMVTYVKDNPRRLGVKREHPELFKVSRDIEVAFAQPGAAAAAPWRGPGAGHFSAIGNHFLLSRPRLVQVQCSRSFFRYRREYAVGPDGRMATKPRICRDADGVPLVEFKTPEFESKLEAALAAGRQGAVIVSPCISHGEREIARQAFVAGYRVVTLQNKGFSPLYKPGGKLFETCASGKLLMLSPVAWPYQPGEKQMSRGDAQVLNRIAQLIAGDGAVEVDYKGAVMRGIDEEVVKAVGMQ